MGAGGGVLTFVLTDLERSTELWERDPDAMRAAMTRHDQIIQRAAERHGGRLLTTRGEGDSTFVTFDRSADGVGYALAVQRAFLDEEWGEPGALAVRIGVHTGEAIGSGDDVTGPEVNRCARVRGLAQPGQILLTEATVERARADLPEGASVRDLGSHRLRGIAAPERIYQLVHPSLPDDFAPVRSLSSVPNNLPAPLTTFIGRTADLDAVRQRLRSHRLVTITGVGGAGKTRLALQVAEQGLSSFGDGVWFVELATVSASERVADEVARSIGLVTEPGQDVVDALMGRFGEARALLVLDNCEHVLDGAGALAEELTAACPHLRLVATSRELLHVQGEALHDLDPLAPPADDETELSSLHASDAVRLFLDRAQLQRADFRLSEDNAAAVATVCRRLDGIPLALELAAARTRTLSVQQIAERLVDRFAVLDAERRSTPRHHRTLETSIAWSVDPLDDHERAVFARFSVFAGGTTLDAAEEVCSADGVPASAVLDIVSTLADRSLVVADTDGPVVRYRMLETVKAFAARMLRDAGDEDRTYAALSAYLRRRMREHDVRQILPQEHGTVEASLRWSLEQDPNGALELVVLVAPAWHAAGDLATERRWTEAVLASAPDVDPELRARALARLAQNALSRRELEEAERRIEQALALTSTPGLRIDYIETGGNIAHAAGRYDDAAARYEEARALAEQAGSDDAVTSIVGSLGMVAHAKGDLAMARERYEEAIDRSKQRENQGGMAWLFANLGSVLHQMGSYDEAVASLEEGMRLAHEAGDDLDVARLRSMLAASALESGDLVRARAAADEAAAARLAQGDEVGHAIATMYGAEIARAQGRLTAAWVAGLSALETFQRVGFERAEAGIQIVLGDVAFDLHRLREASERYRAAIRILSRPGGEAGALAGALEGLAGASVEDDPRTAGLLLGGADRVREASPGTAPPSRAALVGAIRARVVAALGQDADQVLDAGRNASDEVLFAAAGLG